MDLYGCDFDMLNNEFFIIKEMKKAAEFGKTTVLNISSHKFDPQGVTALVLLSESHLSIHTWPEEGYAAIDAFTCGDTADPEKSCNYLKEIFKPKKHIINNLIRGKV